jgi:hypothetical protein
VHVISRVIAVIPHAIDGCRRRDFPHSEARPHLAARSCNRAARRLDPAAMHFNSAPLQEFAVPGEANRAGHQTTDSGRRPWTLPIAPSGSN